MKDTFEQAAVFLAPTSSVAKKLSMKGKISFDPSILATDCNQSGTGKTGVELRYHKQHNVLALPQDQRDKLMAFNGTKDSGKWKGASGKPNHKQKAGGKAGGNASTSNKKLKSMISSMIVKKENAGKPIKSKQDQLTKSLLAMVSSMKSGATNKETKGSIGSATGTNEDQLALAKVAAGQL